VSAIVTQELLASAKEIKEARSENAINENKNLLNSAFSRLIFSIAHSPD